MRLLIPDWQERIAAEQKRRNAMLMEAVMGSDYRAVDECLYACEQVAEVCKVAVRLADLTSRWTADAAEVVHEHPA